MIIDTIDNLKKYKDLNSNISEVVNFCKNKNLQNLPDGRFDIDGDNAFGIVMTMDLRKPNEAKLETHRKYIDIQLVLKNEEKMGYTPLEDLLISEGYDLKTDLEFWQDKIQSLFTVKYNQFAMFFTDDGHMPLIGEGQVKKIVFKLHV